MVAQFVSGIYNIAYIFTNWPFAVAASCRKKTAVESFIVQSNVRKKKNGGEKYFVSIVSVSQIIVLIKLQIERPIGDFSGSCNSIA